MVLFFDHKKYSRDPLPNEFYQNQQQSNDGLDKLPELFQNLFFHTLEVHMSIIQEYKVFPFSYTNPYSFEKNEYRT